MRKISIERERKIDKDREKDREEKEREKDKYKKEKDRSREKGREILGKKDTKTEISAREKKGERIRGIEKKKD